MHETTSLNWVGEKGANVSSFGNEWNHNTKVKRTPPKPCTLVNNVVFHGGMG